MGYTPPAGRELAFTGGAGLFGFSVFESFMAIAFILVVGGVLIAASRLGPRVAFEPILDEHTGIYRPRLTYNGRPLRTRKR